MGNQAAALAKEYYAEFQVQKTLRIQQEPSLIPTLSQELAQLEYQYLNATQHDPLALGHTPTAQSQSHPQAHHATPKTHHQTQNNTPPKPPAQPHLAAERARQEAILNPTTSQASSHGFWPMIDRAANSRIVTAINRAGDNAAHFVADMVNPVKLAKTTFSDANKAVRAYRSGELLKGALYTGKTALDELGFMPLERAFANVVKYTGRSITSATAKLGFFGGKKSSSQIIETSYESLSAARRSRLNAKFERSGNLNLDISKRGYIESLEGFDFKTNVNTKVFYSGPANNLKANIYSQATGKVTIDNLQAGVWLKNQALYDRYGADFADDIWGIASKKYASSARGEVFVFANGANPNRIFNKIELPILDKNPFITNINYLDHPLLDVNQISKFNMGF
jgi:hypothetical protein